MSDEIDPIDVPEGPPSQDAPKPKRQGNYGSKANYKTIELPPEVKDFVDKNPDLPLPQLTKLAWKDDSLDGRDMKGRSIAAYLVSLGKKAITVKEAPRIGKFELNQAHIDTINSMLAAPEPPPVREIVQALFPDMQTITPLHGEYRAVFKYVQEVNENAIDLWDEPVEQRRYHPPRTIQQMVGLINRHVSNPQDPSKALYNANFLRPADEKNIRALLSFLQSKRYTIEASMYQRNAERELFESTFLRLTYDKAVDLSQGEVDLYIQAATKTIQIARSQRTIDGLTIRIEECLNGADDKEGSKAKLSMSLVELVNNSTEKLLKLNDQFKDLQKFLEGERSKKMDARSMRNSSVINILEAWQEESKRDSIIKVGMDEKDADEAEVNRIKNMTDVLGLVAGQTAQEAARG